MTTKYEIDLKVERFARTRPSKFGGGMHGTIIQTGITCKQSPLWKTNDFVMAMK